MKNKDVSNQGRRRRGHNEGSIYQRDIQAGFPVVNEALKVEQYLAEWLISIEPHLRPRSYTRYVAV